MESKTKSKRKTDMDRKVDCRSQEFGQSSRVGT